MWRGSFNLKKSHVFFICVRILNSFSQMNGNLALNMFPYQGNSVFFLRIRRLVSHMSLPLISMNENSACRRTGNSSVECHPIRQQQQQRSCWPETKTKATRTLFPHWGHLPERNVTTASPQWDKHSVCVSLTLADIAAALALRAPRKGSSNVYVCV